MPTMKDVAQKANVGVGTVSRYINQPDSLKESTRLKVERAIQELQYEPNEAARNFKKRQSQSIALIIPTVWHPFYSEFAYHVERELFRRQFKLILCNSRNEVEREIEYIDMLKKNQIDGIIAITYSEEIDSYVTSNLPIVSIDRHFREDVVYVSSDHFKGGQIAIEELLKRGCQSVAYIGSKSKIENESMLRKVGFEQYAIDHQVEYKIVEESEPIVEKHRVIRDFLIQHPSIDGLFCMNDTWAIAAIAVCNELGRGIPNDIQIIGFDGARKSAEDFLTHSTIKQPIEKLAFKAVDALLLQINQVGNVRKHILPVEFYEGNTTKPVDK
ncbi:LacI family DNA-binding transcriptional regulator [Exiguobacterium sp. SL-9]|uniref:LacI family DNA-binding transcriptional regulator n=1 Tax=Exiguobacterium sp. SL-9 TaxID=2510963 RepID=UPI00103B83BF|nr:LacI family DNA-binding transcriptional regulator [Exiguobacterium sp. SL-9]TCI21145.1 LacI family transcriptional regulator [Exiguobacterium sp. SL-9]